MLTSVKLLVVIWIMFIIWLIYNTKIRPQTSANPMFTEGFGNRMSVLIGGVITAAATVVILPFVGYEYLH